MESARSLVTSLLDAAEKAATIARLCRREKALFSLLIEEKTVTANDRFKHDFKTLADVLIQETVRHDLCQRFPALAANFHGEEDNLFTNTNGVQVALRVCETVAQTKALLLDVLDGNDAAASALSAAVHAPVAVAPEPELERLHAHVDTADVGVWIDPVDGTRQYINGALPDSINGVYTSGLRNATVLIGMFTVSTGVPLAGVVNQPFCTPPSQEEDGVWRGRHVWGFSCGPHSVCCAAVAATSAATAATVAAAGSSSDASLRLITSKMESTEVISAAHAQGIHTIHAGGAGYKLLTVIDGDTDAYLLTASSTYKWDTCGPHAILNAAGGGLWNRTGAQLVYHAPDDPADKSPKEWQNKKGLLGILHTAHYDRFNKLFPPKPDV